MSTNPSTSSQLTTQEHLAGLISDLSNTHLSTDETLQRIMSQLAIRQPRYTSIQLNIADPEIEERVQRWFALLKKQNPTAEDIEMAVCFAEGTEFEEYVGFLESFANGVVNPSEEEGRL